MRKLLTRMGFAVSSRDLYKKNMFIGRQSHKGVSMFPFFDKKGHIQAVMLILSQSSEIFILDKSQLNTISIAPPILPLKNKLNMDLSTLKRFANFKKEIFRGLYHFDPWCVLDEVRFKKHWAKEAIKQTNCVFKSNWTSNLTVPRVQDLTQVAYTLDFSRLLHFQGKALLGATNNRALNADIHGFSRELLRLLKWDTIVQKGESVISELIPEKKREQLNLPKKPAGIPLAPPKRSKAVSKKNIKQEKTKVPNLTISAKKPTLPKNDSLVRLELQKQNAALVALSKTPLKTSKIKSKVAPRKNPAGDQWILDPIWNHFDSL